MGGAELQPGEKPALHLFVLDNCKIDKLDVPKGKPGGEEVEEDL